MLAANHAETVVTPGNMHRALSDMQEDWPSVLRTGHGGDPLLIVAAFIRAVVDFSTWTARHARRLSDWLLALRQVLIERFGERWWEALGLPSLWGAL